MPGHECANGLDGGVRGRERCRASHVQRTDGHTESYQRGTPVGEEGILRATARISECMKKRMGTIYIFRNRRNGMEYVGRTARKLKIRIDEEFAEPHTTACTRDLCRAIKRDPTAFDVRRVARCPVDQLKAAEDMYIDSH